MKPTHHIISLMSLLCAMTATAQQVDSLGVSDIFIEPNVGTSVTVSMNVNPAICHLGTDRFIKVMPILRSEDDTFEKPLPSYTIAGRNQYYYNLRSGESAPLYKAGSKEKSPYRVEIPWEDWMGKSRLDFKAITTGCSCDPLSDNDIPVADLDLLPPVIPIDSDLTFIETNASDSKDFFLDGKAYVNFPVNKTEIYPAYMNNPIELRKITQSIDTVRNNPDATITGITLTGYASPEGPYANNVRLAKGRTEAVRDYVKKLYDFPDSVYHTASVPEDWAGLKAAIETSELGEKEEMIQFIDSDYPIEKRNDRFRQLFPVNYPWLLANVYPWLRHTDYLINYTIRRFYDVTEIKEVMKTRPQNLSINEVYLLAESYEVGSPEYNEVFETAARMFPNEAVANLNAANVAIRKSDFAAAESYLSKAGDTPDAEYARGMMAAKKKDYAAAIQHLEKVGTDKAQSAIKRIKEIQGFKGKVTFR